MADPPGSKPAEPEDGGFKGFERSLPENCVEYMLFVIDAKLQPQQVFSRLDAVRKAALQLSSRLTSDYVWQRDAFNVEITTEKGASHTILWSLKLRLTDKSWQALSTSMVSPTMETR